MKQFNTFILVVVFLVAVINLQAQTPGTVEFAYDDSGNRVSRDVIYIPLENNDSGITMDAIQDGRSLLKTDSIHYSANVGPFTINIFPNPNEGKFSVEIGNWLKNTRASLQLHDMKGTEIKRIDICQQYITVDITSQPDGPYILTILVNNQKKTWKVIKR